MRVTLASVIVLMWCAVAVAQPNPEGAKLFEEGRALAAQGKYKEACEKFAKSLELDPAVGTQLNYGDCHEKLGANAKAWRLFDSAADAEKITNPERAKYARGRADALLPKLGVIVLKIGTPDAPMIAVSIGERTVKPAAVIKEIVEPGEVMVTVTAQNAEPFRRSENIAAGKTVTIEVPPFTPAGEPTTGGGGDVVAVPDPSTPPSSDDPVAPRKRSRVVLAYGVAGAGGVALLTGVVLGLKARSDYNAQFDSHCMDTEPRPMCDPEGFAAQNDARSLADVGTVFGVGGLVLIGAGAVLFFTAPREVAVTPTATASSAGISVVGRF